MHLLNLIEQGLKNGGAFNFDPATVTMFGNLLYAADLLDTLTPRPTEEQMATLRDDAREALEKFWAALDQLRAWTPRHDESVRLVDRTGAPLSAKQRRRLVAVH